MNQILITNEKNYFDYFYENKNKKIKKSYLLSLILSLVLAFAILFYLILSSFIQLNQNQKTNNIKDKYNIASLYLKNDNYEAVKLSSNISIIGLIEIPKLDISYPILENSSEDLLKISVCRFSGPLPNRNGNLCIAGHNYKNSLMFSKLAKLEINDSIFITDLNNVKIEYVVYNKYKTSGNNLACTKQTVNTEITLITCNDNNNSERIVVKAKMKG